MFDTCEIEQRIKKKLSLIEFAALSFVIGLAIHFTLTGTGNFEDYKIFLAASQGDLENYFYGYWLLPVIRLFYILPFKIGYMIWIILSLLGVWFATKVFNSNTNLAILSYQMSYVLFWGQITGIICGLLALFWWAMQRHKPFMAGFPLLLAIAKPQSGGVFAFFFG